MDFVKFKGTVPGTLRSVINMHGKHNYALDIRVYIVGDSHLQHILQECNARTHYALVSTKSCNPPLYPVAMDVR